MLHWIITHWSFRDIRINKLTGTKSCYVHIISAFVVHKSVNDEMEVYKLSKKSEGSAYTGNI